MFRLARSSRAITGLASSSRSFHSTSIARDHYLNADPATFKKVIDTSSKPVLVQFTATWCQPCKLLGPILQRQTAPGTPYDLVSIDVDEQPELAGEYKVSAVPFIVAFKDGKPVNKFIGMLPEPKIKEFLSKL